MPAKLDPAVRVRRRKERARHSFSDAAYKHRDGGPGGSADAWKRAAGARLEGEPACILVADADLIVLGLEAMPETEALLRRAYRLASRAAHPDQGGSEAAFVALTQSYERLKERF
jgi:hypothetical protein